LFYRRISALFTDERTGTMAAKKPNFLILWGDDIGWICGEQAS